MNKTNFGQNISIQFGHGIGDAALMAHSIPLYIRRGFKVEIECCADRNCMFLAAGAEIVQHALHSHPWSIPPEEMNKACWNLSRKPMAKIGSPTALWPEYLAVRLSLEPFVTETMRHDVDCFIADLECPIALISSKGHSGGDSVNLPDHVISELYSELLKSNHSVIAMDWNNNCPRVEHPRFRHLVRDWHGIDLPTLSYLMEQSSYLIGVDSGLSHFVRYTDLPCLVVWNRTYPWKVMLPRENTINMMTRPHNYIHDKREEYQIIKGEFSGKGIAANAIAMFQKLC